MSEARFFYVDRGEDDLPLLVETELVAKRGTWHEWRDKTGREWKSRGLGPCRPGRRAAITAYAEANPEELDECVWITWSDGYENGLEVGRRTAGAPERSDAWERGVEHGKAVAQSACGCAGERPSFLRRLFGSLAG